MVILRSHLRFLAFFVSLLISSCSQSSLCSPKNHAALFIFGDSLFEAGNNNYLKNPVGRSLLISSSSQSSLCSPKNHAALFIFGDSLFDAGNNNYLKNPVGRANRWPYGETFFRYPSGRCSDGRIIPDFIAEYLKLPYIRPYLEPGYHQFTDGVNFASAGAGALVEIHQGQTIDLKTQLCYFKKVKKQLKLKLGDTQTKRLLSRAIYLFSIGTNDYLAPILTNSSSYQLHSKDYVMMVIGNLTTVLQEIYKNGGRKFVIVNLGTVGCLPNGRALNKESSGGCIKQATDLVKLHNKELSIVLKQLQSQLQGFKYSNFDFYKSLSERIKNPHKYGFKEAKSACCGTGPFRGMGNCGVGDRKEFELCDNPDEYLFFDVHPSEKANYQFAKLLWSGSTKATKPCNLEELLQI